ncbi:MAG TPA: 4-hydroxy-3-methylbut-2-enyl diphosphate reductase [Methylococcales bacterium]
MKVVVAQKCGFCLGVKNAIRMARETLREHNEVYSLGPVIHNEDVVRQLAEDGLKTVKTVERIPSGTVLIRSHGATIEEIEKIKQKGLEIVDATCVLVKRVQKITKQLHDDGYQVVIIGDKNHPEVQAVVGHAPNIVVVADESDLDKLPKDKKLGIICQTTQSPGHFGEMVGLIAKRGFSELKVVNTLCKEAINRQESAVELCKRVDIMFVLGGLNSANTRKLAELCKKYNLQTFHLQNWNELDKTILSGKTVAGVTAGASTPDQIIEEFVEKLRAFDPA